MPIFRRIRGVMGAALVGAMTWAPIAMGTVVALRLGVPGVPLYFPASMSHALALAAVLGAAVGALIGVVFGVLVWLSERNRAVECLRTTRVMALGAMASAGVCGVVYGNAWTVVGGRAFGAAALGVAVLGAASSASVLWLARRALPPTWPAPTEPPQLPRGAT